jgi:phage terminase small subunit
MARQRKRAPKLLTDKQRRFVAEYIVDLNAAAAYRRAGYKVSSNAAASANAARLIAKDSIQTAIQTALADRAARTQTLADQVVRALVNIAFSDRSRIAEWDKDGVTFRKSTELTADEKMLVESCSQTITAHGGTIRVELCNRLGALKMLGEHLGLFDDLSKIKRELEELKKLVQPR